MRRLWNKFVGWFHKCPACGEHDSLRRVYVGGGRCVMDVEVYCLNPKCKRHNAYELGKQPPHLLPIQYPGTAQ